MSWKKLFEFTKKNFRKYDLIFDLHTEPRNILLGKFLGKNIVGYGSRGLGFLLTKKGRINMAKHIVEQNLDLLKIINLKIQNKNPKLFLTTKEKNNAKKLIEKLDKKKKVIGIHPGVSDNKRQWPLEKFRKLINLLKEDYNILLLDNSKKRAQIVKNNFLIFDLSGKLNIRQFFAIIKEIDLLIGLESLSVHVAAAVGTKSVTIFSSTTNPKVMGPYSNKTRLIYKKIKCVCCNNYYCPNNDGVKKITVEEVYQVVKKQLK
jgi:ADP-heptose:LPS heptosyltransferase